MVTNKSLQTHMTLTLSQTTNHLDSSKLKDFADDNFKLDKNGGKSSKTVENTVGKEEIAEHGLSRKGLCK